MNEPASGASLWFIYQPLIVGLGAVVLGFLASVGLEVWKDRVRRQFSRDKLRNALIFEFRMFRQSIEFEKLSARKGKDTVSISLYLPALVEEIDRIELGSLGYPEVCVLADFMRMLDRLRAITAGDQGALSQGGYYTMHLPEKDVDLRQEIIEQFIARGDAVLNELQKSEKNPIDWRNGLPPNIQKQILSE